MARLATRTGCPLSAEFILAVLVFVVPVSAQQNSATGALTRPCKATDQEAAAAKKPAKRKKGSAEEAAQSGRACLEVRSSSLDVQEQLQATVREQRWRIGDEEISESLWTFSLILSESELRGYTNPNSAAQRVQWKSGKAVVSVRNADLGDGYTRAVASAHFEGFGESEDTFAVQRASWVLPSNGKLESTLLQALQTRLHAKR